MIRIWEIIILNQVCCDGKVFYDICDQYDATNCSQNVLLYSNDIFAWIHKLLYRRRSVALNIKYWQSLQKVFFWRRELWRTPFQNDRCIMLRKQTQTLVWRLRHYKFYGERLKMIICITIYITRRNILHHKSNCLEVYGF